MSDKTNTVPAEIANRFKDLNSDLQATLKKVSELEDDARDHARVISTLEELGPDRRCFRLVGDVLVERTQPEILEAVKLNRQQLLEIAGKFNTHSKDVEKEMQEIETKYAVREN
ncbi:hypothetical protein WA158_001487 [Blastocystis sp. Blastoise]